MKFHDYLRVARKFWRLIAVITVVVFGVTAYFTLTATPLYRSTAAIYVSPEGSTPNELSQGTSFLQGQMESYAELLSTSTVLDPVIEQLGLQGTARELSRSISAAASSDSVILKVTATSESADLAAEKANAAANSLSQRITDLAPNRPDGNPSVEVALVQEANVPSQPFSPNTQRNLVAGLLGGLVLGYLAALARAMLDTRLQSTAELRAIVQAPVLAEVPATRNTTFANDSRGSYVEAINRLRANLDFVDVGERPLQLVVTSSTSGEGKSTVALNIARACSESGQRVLLIDADLRRPTLHSALGVDSTIGLSTVLAGKSSLADATLTVGRRRSLCVLTSGVLPPNPTELLGSPAMDALLEEAKRDYDIIIIDSPPVLPVVDALVLARKASGALLVARLGRIHRDALKHAVESFHNSNSPLFGVVINGLPKSEKSPYHNASKPTPSEPAAGGKTAPGAATGLETRVGAMARGRS